MQKGWTILFFICEEDTETKEYAENLINDLLKTNDDKDLCLLCFESIRTAGPDGPLNGLLSILDYNPETKSREKKQLRDFGVVDPGNESVLKNALTYIKEKGLLREKFLLFTWDHGAGFGIFAGDPRDRNETGRKILRIHPGPRLHMLTSIQINHALGSLGRKTDLVIMMNCWTKMLETGYELAENVDISVAPETVDYFAGYDYIKIINQLAANPNSIAEEIAVVAVDSIPAKFDQSVEFKTHLKDVVIRATRLSQSADTARALDTVAVELTNALSNQFSAIRHIREHCIDFSYGYFLNAKGKPDDSIADHYIDLVHYVAMLAKKGLVRRESLDRLKISLDHSLLRLYRGEKYDAPDPNAFGIKQANGLSIFHPDKTEDFESVYYQYFYQSKKLRLANTAWGEFLDKYKLKGNR
jgi:hypothetical protein